MSSLDKDDVVLLALQDGRAYSPVQVQKLLFLIEKKAFSAKKSLFNFTPYHYGPFDKEIYSVLDELKEKGLVDVHCNIDQKHRRYCLTDLGIKKAEKIVTSVKDTNDYIKKLADYVYTQSFTELVSAIYQEYPDMKENSIFTN